jgi:hypothetical protein
MAAYAGVLATTITLSAPASVALAGDFAGENVCAGGLYFFVTQDSTEAVRIVGQVSAQTFSPGASFTAHIVLPPGTYSIGLVGRPTDQTTNLYAVNKSGRSGSGASENEGSGADNITRTLSATVVTGGVGVGGDFSHGEVHAPAD